MKPRVLLIPTVVLAIGGGLVWSLISRGSLTKRSAAERPLQPAATSAARTDVEPALPATDIELPPRAVVPVKYHDFGTMDPYRVGHHTFVIRNEGEGPLKLKAAGSTCKCTVGKLASDTIAPGEESQITLDWKTVPQTSEFSHSATVITNDPNNSRIRFSLRGHVQQHLGADPPELLLPRIHPGQTASSGTIVSSQVWPEFDIRSVESSHPGVTWEIEPVDKQVLEALGSLSGYMLSVTLPNNLPAGQFNHSLTLTVSPRQNPEETRQYNVMIVGSVLRRLAVYGEGIDATGTIRFGRLDWGKGATKSFLVKVYDDDPELQLKAIEVTPDWVRARLTPERVEAGRPGLYRLTVEIPADAPVGSFTASRAGYVRLVTGHPRIGQTQLELEYAIPPPQRRHSLAGKEQ